MSFAATCGATVAGKRAIKAVVTAIARAIWTE
jgi:TusA-related sulfurtransferase